MSALDGPLACRQPGVDPDLFFPSSPAEHRLAASLCAMCPARPACLTYAVELHTSDGVWGGVLFERGKVIPVKRTAGRPRT